MSRLDPDPTIMAIVQALGRTPQTAAQIAAKVGVHPRTARRALADLATADRVTLHEPAATGVGRPAARYSKGPERAPSPAERDRGRVPRTNRDALRRANTHRRTAVQAARQVAAIADTLAALPAFRAWLAEQRRVDRALQRKGSRRRGLAASLDDVPDLPRAARAVVTSLGALETALARVELG